MTSFKPAMLPLLATLLYTTTVSAAVGYPKWTSETKCDGLVRPTWTDCETIAASLQGPITAGPGFLVGTVFRQGNCQVRFVACDPAAAQFQSDASIVKELMGIVKDTCGQNVGGAHRYGQACVVVEDPENNFQKRDVSRIEWKRMAEIGIAVQEREANPSVKARSAATLVEEREANPSVKVRSPMTMVRERDADPSVKPRDPMTMVRERDANPSVKARAPLTMVRERDAAPSAMEERAANPSAKARSLDAPYGQDLEARQCNPPPNPCFKYTELTFFQNVRGEAFKVCENVLPDGASCAQTRSATVTQSVDIGFEIGVNVADVVSVGTSFTQSSGTSNTETLATTITVSCKDGEKKGYVVWFPYFEVSRGRCGRGTSGDCNGNCYVEEEKSCEIRRPVMSGFGALTGEYGVVCI